jgi:pyruvate dehydrogenase E2 component (dihydrolipoamide acetyltransferase)
MAYKIVMPQLGLTMEEGSVTSWLKKPGEFVEKGDVLFTVETDKIEMEVESMGRGYLGPIQVELGVKVRVGTLLAMLNDKPENTA